MREEGGAVSVLCRQVTLGRDKGAFQRALLKFAVSFRCSILLAFLFHLKLAMSVLLLIQSNFLAIKLTLPVI